MKLKIMSFNIRMATKHDGINFFPNRTDCIRKMIDRESPDIIGIQEV